MRRAHKFAGEAIRIAFDAGHQRILAIGGSTPDLGKYEDRPDELWALDRGAAAWTQICAGCDQGRAGPALVQVADGTYLLNGYGNTGELAGSWVLDNGRTASSSW